MNDTASPLRDALDHPQAAPQLAEAGDPGPELDRFERPPFPPGCPIKPLGISSNLAGSQLCFYLDSNKQLVGLEAGNRHGKNSLIALFGDQSDWLEASFPQYSKPVRERDKATKEWVIVKESEIVGFDQAEASRALIEECARRGIFTAAGKMRGPGAHRHRGGGLVLHCGDKMLVTEHNLDGTITGTMWIDPGLHDNFVYPGREVVPRPDYQSVTPAAAVKLLKLYNTWNWRRPLLDAVLLLGGTGASHLGGWLHWRPNLWITGGAGTGKSTLNGQNGVLHELFGEGLFRTGNASAAAIRQSLENATIPVMLDEIEAAEDNRKVKDVLELARVASSGDKFHRGGQDHKAHEFTLRSCFWFSSINIPPLETQDRSRLGILELQPFEKGSTKPDLAALHLPKLGRELQRRMVDAVPVLDAVKEAYARALAVTGHVPRGCDQFGTLLACAHVLLNDVELVHDELPDDELMMTWVDLCRPERMAEISENDADHTKCLHHLTTTQVQARGGDQRVAVSTWIGDAVAAAIDPMFDEHGQSGADDRAAKRLQEYGMKLVNATYHPAEHDLEGKLTKSARWGSAEFVTGVPIYLAVAGDHQALAGMFQGKTWQNGVWRGSLGRTPGALDGVKVKFNRASLTAVLVPLHHVLDVSELPDASKPAAAAKWVAEMTEGAAA